RLGRRQEALAAVEEALRMDPLLSDAVPMRVEILWKLGRKAEATQAYDGWAATDTTGNALNWRCWNRAVENTELDKAESDCAAALKLGPNRADFWDSYGLVAFKSGRLDDARQRYDHAL